MQLVIPMSGIGQRFIDAGYKTPKPLIEINSKTIIHHVYKMFPDIESVTFICNEKHLEDSSLRMFNEIKKIDQNANVISIKPHKYGPIHAVLKAINYLDLNSPTIVNYCDFNCIWNYKEFLKHVKRTDCDGCVVTYTGFHPHMLDNTNYAYIKLNGSKIIDIQEKKPFTSQPMNEDASSGTYYFKTASIMKKYFEKTIKNDINVKGEYYVSLSYKAMIKDNLKINNFNLEYFMQWGTPSDMEDYKWYSNLFKSKIRPKRVSLLQKGTLIIPCAGLGKRFSESGYKLPKPFIEVSGKPMINQAFDDLPSFENVKLIFRREILNKYELSSKFRGDLKDANIQIIDSITNGQASTCLLGLENVDLSKPMMISACDNGLIYDYKKFKELTQDDSIDLIVWGCRNFPGARKNPEMYGWIEEENSIVKKVYVKKGYKNPKTDPIITGTFYFGKAEIYKKLAEKLLKSEEKVNNEFYVDSAINIAIKLGLKVIYFEIDYYLCWGTPDDLKTYNYWQNCFHKWKDHPYRKELDDDFL